MAPAALIVGGVVVAVGACIIFHQFVYEPHLAPKIEIAVETWLERRRSRRRHAAAYRNVPDSDTAMPGEDDDQDGASKHSDVEMDSISTDRVFPTGSLQSLHDDSGASATLRRRNAPVREQMTQSDWTLKPTLIQPLAPTPVTALRPSSQGPAPLSASVSRSSTPSTVASSLLNSPIPPAALSPSRTLSPSNHSDAHDPLADSILSYAPAQRSTLFSTSSTPDHASPAPICPRGLLQIQHSDSEDEEPLSRVRQRMSGPGSVVSSMYESFAGAQWPTGRSSGSTPQEITPPLSRVVSPSPLPNHYHNHHPLQQQQQQQQYQQAGSPMVRSPFSDSLSIVDHPATAPGTAPGSTASWSDVGSPRERERVRDLDELSDSSEGWAHARRQA